MPSRKLTSHCPHCGCKNHLRSAHCNQCGGRLKDDRAARDQEGRTKLYADIAHPINSQCRELIQSRVIAEYQAERERAKQPDYVSRYDDDFDDDAYPLEPEPALPPRSTISTPPGEHAHIEPAAGELPPPHTAPARQPTKNPPRQNRRGGFGEGIF